MNAKWQGIITSLDLLGMFLLIQTKMLLAIFLSGTFSACCGLSATVSSSPSPQLIFSNHSSPIVQPHLLFRWYCSSLTACGDLVPPTCFSGCLHLSTYTWGVFFFTLFYHSWGVNFPVPLHLLLSVTAGFYLMTTSPSSITPSLKYFSTGWPAWSQRWFCPALLSGPCFFPAAPLRDTNGCQSQTPITRIICAQSGVDPQDPCPTPKPCPCRINENTTWGLMSYTFTPLDMLRVSVIVSFVSTWIISMES